MEIWCVYRMGSPEICSLLTTFCVAKNAIGHFTLRRYPRGHHVDRHASGVDAEQIDNSHPITKEG